MIFWSSQNENILFAYRSHPQKMLVNISYLTFSAFPSSGVTIPFPYWYLVLEARNRMGETEVAVFIIGFPNKIA